MEFKDIKQNILDQFEKLESELIIIKYQLKKDKTKLNNPNFSVKLNKSRNFFTENIINKIQTNINNQNLIKKSNESIKIIEEYIDDVKKLKYEISNQAESDKYDLKSLSQDLADSISSVSSLCAHDVEPPNTILQTGKTLLYGGGLSIYGGLASMFLCPMLSPFLIAGGVVGCASGTPLMIIGNVIESIKNKTKNILSATKNHN